MGFINRLKKQDWLTTIILVVLGFLSVILIFSTTYNAQNTQQGEGTTFKQIIFLFTGFGIYFLLTGIDLSWLKQKGVIWAIYLAILSSLIYLILFGEVREQTQRWILLGPFTFQPAEFAKIIIVIVTSYIFTSGIDDIRQQKELRGRIVSAEKQPWWQTVLTKKIIISVLSLVVYLILIYLQPALGNSLIVLFIWAILLYMVLPISARSLLVGFVGVIAICSYYKVGVFAEIAAASYLPEATWKIFTIIALGLLFIALRYTFKVSSFLLAIVFLTVVAVAPLADWSWNNVLKNYQRSRITVFFNPQSVENAEQTTGYQVRQSLIAIGSGQLYGTGFMRGSQSTLQTLPFAHTDFIFAALAEQFGFLGVIALLGLYALLVWRIIITFLNTSDRFGKLLVIGCLSILLINIFVNISMNLGLIPVTGVTLPLVSYGGSSVLVIMISMALVQMVKISTRSTDYSEKFNWKL